LAYDLNRPNGPEASYAELLLSEWFYSLHDIRELFLESSANISAVFAPQLSHSRILETFIVYMVSKTHLRRALSTKKAGAN